MSVYNCERTVAPSVRSIINQSFRDWELIVIDDGSTDATLAQLRSFQDERIKILHDDENKGLPTRLNEAIARASGEYLARMDGDDVSYPNRLELQLEYLQSHSEVDLVGGGMLVFGAGGKVIGKRILPEAHEAICRRPHSGFPIAHPTYFGKTCWFRLHKYCETALLSQDQGLLLRAFSTSHFSNVPHVLLGYREAAFDLRKVLEGRRFYSRMVLAEYSQKGRPLIGWYGLLGQYIKGAVDIVAVVTGLQYHLLRQRANPVNSEEIAQWQEVWRAVGGSEHSEPNA